MSPFDVIKWFPGTGAAVEIDNHRLVPLRNGDVGWGQVVVDDVERVQVPDAARDTWKVALRRRRSCLDQVC